MKKLFCLILILMVSFGAFAKEKSLQVTETEWGFEVSNINSKGKIICKGYLDCELTEDVFVILRKKDSKFNLEAFAEEIVNNEHKSNVFVLNEKGFSELERNEKTESGADTGLVLLDIAIAISEATEKEGFYLGDSCESLLVLAQKGKISQVEAYQNGRNMQLAISDLQKADPTQLEVLVTEKKAEKNKLSSNKNNSVNPAADEKAKLKELWEKAGREGYDNMPWGTTIDQLMLIHPEVKKIKYDGVEERFSRQGSQNNVELTYRFYKGKLVGGITVYKLDYPKDEETVDAINHRMIELYGNPTDVKESSEHHVEQNTGVRIAYTEYHGKVTWNKSSKFKILFDFCALDGDTVNDNLNIALFITVYRCTLTITYDDPSMAAQIAADDEKFKQEKAAEKKRIEEENRRKRMDNLDL